MTDDQLRAARESFSGKSMTDTQLQKTHAIAEILHAEIQRSGSFKEGLTDFAHAFSRSERFDALRGETMIRDIYQASYGQTLNQTREALLAAEENLPEQAMGRALESAEAIGEMIQAEPTQPFYQAYDRAAVTMAGEFGITQNAAKGLMADAFKQRHGRELYEHGKEVEDAYHKPVREAEIAARKAEQLQSRNQGRSYQ